MHSSIRATFALDPTADRDAIEAALLSEPGVTIAGFVDAAPSSLHSVVHTSDDALVVACAGDSDEVLRFISGAADQRPDRPIVVLYEGTANGFLRRAIDAGADDLLSDAGGREIAFALEKAVARKTGYHQHVAPGMAAATPVRTGEMITVLGPKGGTGKTLTTCNLAAALVAEGQRVVVVDLDLQFGDVALALGMPPERTMYDLAISGGSIDAEKVEDFLLTHPSGVEVLMAPRRPDHAGSIRTEFLRDLFDTLRGMCDYVIVDTPPGFTPEVIVAIDKSSAVCMVAMLDAPSLKNTKLGLETLDLMHYDRDNVRVVLNRADSRVGVAIEDVRALLGRSPDVLVPSSRDITRSVNEATPIVLSNDNPEARKAFIDLAHSLLMDGGASHTDGSTTTTADKKRKGGFLRRGRKES